MDIRRTISTTLMAIGGGLAVCGVLPGAVTAESSTMELSLHNSAASAQTDCPNSTDSWWHFVIAPNSGRYAFSTIHLTIGGSGYDFSGGSIVKNGSQGDNVFVKVPTGSEITDLSRSGSYAVITPGTAVTPAPKFVLSHTCVPAPEPPTTTIGGPTTTDGDTDGSTTTTDGESGGPTSTTDPCDVALGEALPITCMTTTTEGDTDGSTTTTDGESEPPLLTTTTDNGFSDDFNTSVPDGFDSRGLLPTTGGEVAALVVLGLILALTGGVIRVTGRRRPA